MAYEPQRKYNVPSIDDGRNAIADAVRQGHLTTMASGEHKVATRYGLVTYRGNLDQVPSQVAVARAFGLPHVSREDVSDKTSRPLPSE